MRSRSAVLVAAIVALIGTAFPAALPAYADVHHAEIDGTGSSWSANAVNAWVSDVDNLGLKVVFTPTGSAQGRKDFANGTKDYAVTDIAYQGTDPNTGADDTSSRPYAYLPIVAGGTAFPYELIVRGQRITNLRLSGLTLAKIFTNQITNWNDPAITSDNNGRQLPSLKITPVVHSEGSGSSAQFSLYLAKEFPGIWKPFNNNRDTMTEYFPLKGRAIAQNGSDGVINYISSSAGNGSIGYDEYSYAQNKGIPVAGIENKAGYFIKPDQYNVAVALTQAEIDNNPKSPTYLIQTLDKVYVYGDKRTYPLSSYSYMVLPIGNNTQDPKLGGKSTTTATAKRQTMVDFLYYSICIGQEGIGNNGYSPLPVNLVSAGFGQIQKLKTADPAVDITKRDVQTCHNPTFDPSDPSKNKLAEIAPNPPACDKAGAGPCADGATGGPGGSKGNNNGGGGAATGGGANGPKATISARVDQDTGVVASAGPGAAAAQANELAAGRDSALTGVLRPLVLIELAAILVGPIVLLQWLGRRRREQS